MNLNNLVSELDGLHFALSANNSGIVKDTHKKGDAEQLAAFGAYSAHCMKTIEDDLGMQTLRKLVVQGDKKLVVHFKEDGFCALMGSKTFDESIELNN
jgi:predicted regulator of Ras-like GTPase activity (Roadblock/LC7/MglB family)